MLGEEKILRLFFRSSSDRPGEERTWPSRLRPVAPLPADPDLGRRSTPARRSLNDLIVAVIVTVMLIPQSLAYALLAGLPPQVGLYASMAPLVLYAIFGTSRALAVGPVAVASLMTAAAAGTAGGPGNAGVPGGGHRARAGLGAAAARHGAAAAGVSRELPQPPGHLGLHHGLGHPDRGRPARARARHPARRARPSWTSLKSLGAQPRPDSIPTPRRSASRRSPSSSGCAAASSRFCAGLGSANGRRTSWPRWAPPWPSSRPPLAVWGFGLDDARRQRSSARCRRACPSLALPPFDAALWTKLLVPALLISIVGYVESISVALTLAAKRRQRVDPDQELIALGAAEHRRGRLGRISRSPAASRARW